MHILGLSCFYHDSAACLLSDGIVAAACQEERFSRVKHDWQFPERSVSFCCETAGISPEEIDAVIFYEKPLLKFERMIETFLSVAPRGYRAFIEVMPSWLKQKLWLPSVLQRTTGYSGRILYSEHHLSHAASAFFTSPFDRAAVLTIDGVGEWATASYGSAEGSTIKILREMHFPNSLGLLYSTVTSFLGFTVNHDEYKVMGMAAYGSPVHCDAMLKEMVRVRPDGSLALNMDYFSFQYGRRMYDMKRFTGFFGIPQRTAGGELAQAHFDIAASLQKVTETVIERMAAHVRSETGLPNLCLAGGIALNSVANGKLLMSGIFDDIYVQPAAGDAGGAVGAAYVAYHHFYGMRTRHRMGDLYLGPSFSTTDIIDAVGAAGLRHAELSDSGLTSTVARLLADGKVIGWFQGRMEFGPRGLGNRSILADPTNPGMKDIVNHKVKYRESFRPFAPVITIEDTKAFFALDRPSPYMLMTVPVLSGRIPAVTHADRSARVQTLDRTGNPRLYALLREFEKISGVPVLLNTSLNIKGEPIAMTPADAVRCFLGSGMDALVLENILLIK